MGLLFAQGYYMAKVGQGFLGRHTQNEIPTCAARRSDGFTVIGGYTTSAETTLPDGWLLCLAPDGSEAWSLTPGGMGPDRIESVVIKDSVVFFCGYSGSALSHPEDLPVERRADFWAGAVELFTGKLLWQSRWGSPHIDAALTVCPTPYRTLLIGGLTWADTLTGMQGAIYVLNERTGEILNQTFWGKAPSLIRQIRPTGEGRTFACIGEQEYRPFLAEIDYLGQVYWRTVFQFHRFPSQLHALYVAQDGRIFVGGRYGHQWGISAFSPKGQIIWEKVWSESPLTGAIHDIKEGPEGVIYALGWQQGEALISPEQRGGEDIWLAALTREGRLLWERGFGGPYDERGVALLTAQDSLILIAAKENRFTEAPRHADAWQVILKAIPCDKAPLQLRSDVPTLREKAGRPIRFWIDIPPMYVVEKVVWDFGDGTTAEGNPVEHIFASPGTYSIQAQVALKYGCRDIYLPPMGLRITRP